jgi:hypothetical protein
MSKSWSSDSRVGCEPPSNYAFQLSGVNSNKFRFWRGIEKKKKKSSFERDEIVKIYNIEQNSRKKTFVQF